LTDEKIPDEYWPRCDLCGQYLGEGSVEIKTFIMMEPRRICFDCEYAIRAIVEEAAPIMVGKFLSRNADRDLPEIKRLGLDVLKAMARRTQAGES